jgi:hypothetical protein
VLTFILGPVLALLPKAWRNSLPGGNAVNWRTAAAISGFGESLLALITMMIWYSYSVTGWVERGIDSAMAGKTPQGVTDHDIGFMALLIFATHPLTWLIACAGVEGMVRFVGTFTETYLGIFPLFVLEKILRQVSGPSEPGAAKASDFSQGHFSSYVGAIREKAMLAKLPQVPDELCFRGSGPEEVLEIRACRRKPDWNPPRIVRYQDAYFRLESCSEGTPPRPYRYTLRRLSAGVMGRTVLVYLPNEPLVRRSP